MTDLAKCAGRDCPQRESCLRYTAPPNGRPLSSFDAYLWQRVPSATAHPCDGYWPIRVQPA